MSRVVSLIKSSIRSSGITHEKVGALITFGIFSAAALSAIRSQRVETGAVDRNLSKDHVKSNRV